jgi:predicted  nucleic acid-binding Zn-ribbon protein
MNLEHAIIALTKEVHNLTEKVDFLTEEVNRHSDELRRQGVMIEHLDAKIGLLIDGYGALGKEMEDFRGEVNKRFKEIDYKFEAVFEDVGMLRKEFYAFCHG